MTDLQRIALDRNPGYEIVAVCLDGIHLLVVAEGGVLAYLTPDGTLVEADE